MNKNKTKLVKASIISTIVILSGVGATALMSKPEPAVKEVKQSAEVKSTPVATPEAVTPVEQSTPATEVVEPVEVQPVAEPPKARTALEIAEQDYPHLFNHPSTYACFDKIIAGLPQYFAPERLEQSMVLFGKFASACGALGIKSLIPPQNLTNADISYSLIAGNLRNYYGDPQPY